MFLLVLFLLGTIGIKCQVFWSFAPDFKASGQLPSYAVATISLSTGAFGPLVTDTVTFSYASPLKCEVPGCLLTGADTWKPFNRLAPAQDTVNSAVETLNLQGAINIAGYKVTTQNGCVLNPDVSSDGVSLTATVEVATRCQHTAGTWVNFYIPYYVLTANPDFPSVQVFMTATMNAAAAASGTLAVRTPWLTTVPETKVSALIFVTMYPGDVTGKPGIPNTIAGSALSSLIVSFVPGIQLIAGGYITVEARGGSAFFDSVTSTNGAPTLALGPNCALSPASLYCCSASTAITSVPAASANQIAPGWSSITITLGPDGCIIPASKRVEFVIPEYYAGNNPSVAAKGNTVDNFGFGFAHVDFRMQTSAEPTPVHLRRYGETWPLGNLIKSGGATSTLQLAAANLLPADVTVQAGGPSPYVVGPSQLTAFSATPDTFLANVVPTTLSIQFTLATSATFSTTNSPGTFIITAHQGVFRANVANPKSPNTITAFTPAECAPTATYFTSAWSTLFVFPAGSANNAACTAKLVAGTVVKFTLSSDVLLPNGAAGLTIRFDIRFMPSLATTATNLLSTAAAGDSAALMNQFGWNIIAACGTASSPSYSPGALADISTLPVASRCDLVRSMSLLSPLSGGGILQCTATNALVTFVKVPEAVWTSNLWPLTNVATLGNWPQSIGLPTGPPSVITQFGYMFSDPMYAIVTSYPLNTDLRSLGLNPTVPSNYALAFMLRMSRLTMSCALADTSNPWSFQVSTCTQIARLTAFTAATGSAGTNVESISGSSWGSSNCVVLATLSHSGIVVGWTVVQSSPTPTSSSDDAWFGLLALIAIPLLLCACLSFLLWRFLRPSAEPPVMNTYPVQEDTWAVPPAPAYAAAAYPGPLPMGLGPMQQMGPIMGPMMPPLTAAPYMGSGPMPQLSPVLSFGASPYFDA